MLHFVTPAPDLMTLSPIRILYSVGTETMSAFIHYSCSTCSKIGSQCTCSENEYMKTGNKRVAMKKRGCIAKAIWKEENVYSIQA